MLCMCHSCCTVQSCPTLGPCLQPGISLVDVEGRETAAGSSWLNRDEAQAVARILRQLLSPNGDGSGSSSSSVLVARGIGIITPYKAMVQELRSVMARVPGAGEVEVNTVDAFQVLLEHVYTLWMGPINHQNIQ